MREGDHRAFTQIYERYKGLLIVHASKKLDGNLEEAKEIVQEIFSNLWYNRYNSPEIANVSAYLYRITRNRILNHIEHQTVVSRYADDFTRFSSTYNAPTDERIREKQLLAIIDKEIAALPPKMKEVFLLSRRAHLSHKEIAQKLDISENTVKNHIKSALKILRTRLDILTFLILLCRY